MTTTTTRPGSGHDVRSLLESVRAQLERAARLSADPDAGWRVGVTYARISVDDALARLTPPSDDDALAPVRPLPSLHGAALPRRRAV